MMEIPSVICSRRFKCAHTLVPPTISSDIAFLPFLQVSLCYFKILWIALLFDGLNEVLTTVTLSIC